MVDLIEVAKLLKMLTIHYQESCILLGHDIEDRVVALSKDCIQNMLAPCTPEELAGLCAFARDAERQAGICRAALVN